MVNSSSLLAVIVSYNPDKNLLDLVEKLSKFTSKIVVVDNGSHNSNYYMELLCEYQSLSFYQSSQNKGIAWGINKGIEIGLSENIKYVITFDQDSLPIDNFLDYYNELIIQENNEKIGLISCMYTDSEDVLIKKKDLEYHKELSLITSGMLHNVAIFKEIGLYNEAMFIDYVDFEFVLRSAAAGWNTYRIDNPILKHRLGEPLVKRFGKYRIKSTNHSPLRRYYQMRNYVYVMKKYFLIFPFWSIKKTRDFFVSLLLLLLVDTQKMEKMKMMCKGFKDGIKGF